MSYSTRVFVVAIVLVLLALASCGSAFDIQSLLRAAEHKAALRQSVRDTDFDVEIDTCTKVTCDLPVGNDSCHEQFDNTTTHFCDGTAFCNSTGHCETKLPVGAECTQDNDCASTPFHPVYCQANETTGTHVCTAQKLTAFAGEACSKDNDCYSNICQNNVCVGLQEDEECHDTFACAFGLYCNATYEEAGVCMNATAAGDNCTTNEECAFVYTGNVCLNGVCARPFGIAEDGACDPHGFEQCGADLYCDPASSTCKKYQHIECENNTVCEESMPSTTCRCSQLSGSGVCGSDQTDARAPGDTAKYMTAAIECALENGCPVHSSECLYNHCMADLECMFSEMAKGVDADPACFGYEFKCDPENPSEDSSASTISTAAGVVVSALAAMAALL